MSKPYNLKFINNQAFMRCSKLEYIDFPSSLRKIGVEAIRETGLKPNLNGNTYYFGDNLYSIGRYAFN